MANERIDQLAAQAEEWVCKNYPDAIDDYDEFHVQAMYKLAELFIRECADIARMNQYQPSTAGTYVLKHFGVSHGN